MLDGLLQVESTSWLGNKDHSCIQNTHPKYLAVISCQDLIKYKLNTWTANGLIAWLSASTYILQASTHGQSFWLAC